MEHQECRACGLRSLHADSSQQEERGSLGLTSAMHFLCQLLEPQYELLQPQPMAECIPISLQFLLKALSTEHSSFLSVGTRGFCA